MRPGTTQSLAWPRSVGLRICLLLSIMFQCSAIRHDEEYPHEKAPDRRKDEAYYDKIDPKSYAAIEPKPENKEGRHWDANCYERRSDKIPSILYAPSKELVKGRPHVFTVASAIDPISAAEGAAGQGREAGT